MAIQHRRGVYDRFDPSRLVAGEWAIVLSGDTSASDGRAAYICFAAGTVKRIATYEDMAESIANANEELIEELTAQITAATTAANTAASNANTKATAANTAASSANTAASAANTAASNANSKATAANTAASSANSAASSATTAAGRANTAADAANAAATSATEAAESVSDAAYRAETAATSANTAAGSANAAAQRANTAADSANAATSEANAAIEAMGDISELAVPEMTANVRGGAKVGGSTQVVDEKLEIKLSESDTGTSVTTGSTSALRALEVHGRSIQDGTPTPDAPVPVQVVGGANAWHESVRKVGVPYTNVGITWTKNADGTYTANGTATANAWAYAGTTQTIIDMAIPLSPGIYTATTNAQRCTLKRVSGGATSDIYTGFFSSRTFTVNDGESIFICPEVPNGTTVTNETYYVQIVPGSNAFPYVPYGSIGVKVAGGKNLVDFAHPAAVNTDGGVTFTINADGSYGVHGTATKNTYIYVTNNASGFQLPAGSYTFSARNQDGSYPPVLRVGASRWLNGTNTSLGSASDHALTFNHDGQGNLQFIVYVNNGGTVDATVYPQLEAGGQSTPYVPYVVGDTVTSIDLQGNTLASLPDGTRDELHVDSAGHCVLTKNVGKYVITGQENGSTEQENNYYRFYSRVIEVMQAPLRVPQGNTNGYCTHSQYTVSYTGQNAHAYVVNTKRFLVFSTNATPLSEYVGAELYYPLATPQTIDLGYITPPAIPSGSVVTVSASLTPTFHLDCWTEHASELAEVIYDKQESIASSIVGGSTQVVDEKLEIKLSESDTGTSVTTGSTSALRGLQVHGKSVQNGTPTPDAPVPVQVVSAKNLLDVTMTSQTMNGLMFTVNPDKTISVTGTASDSTYVTVGAVDLPDGTYRLSGCPAGGGNNKYRLYYNRSGGVEFDYGRGVTIITNNDGRVQVRIAIYAGTTVNMVFRPQVELGSTNTPYVPYGSIGIVVGDTATPIDLQGNTLASLPDGTHDELHIDSAGRVWIEKRTGRILTPTDVSNVNNLTQVTNGARWNIDVDGLTSEEIPNGSTNGYCSHTPFSRTLAIGSFGSHVFTFGGKVYYVIEGDFTATTAVTWVNSHQMTIIYPLATTQTIDLGYIDPPAIPSGSVVTVSASLTPTFDLDCWTEHASEIADIPDAITTLAEVIYDKQESIASSIAPVEGSTASANHAVGDYLMLGARLYRVTTAIASGERIIPGTNVTETTVMAEIVSLLS